MPLPKKKLSKSKSRQRRSHDALVAPTLGTCPQCEQPRLSHHVCPSCGHYRGRQVFKVASEDEV